MVSGLLVFSIFMIVYSVSPEVLDDLDFIFTNLAIIPLGINIGMIIFERIVDKIYFTDISKSNNFS